jgi:MFS family permease
VAALRKRLSESFSAFGRVFSNPDLRRVELAFAGSILGYWAYGVAIAVFAYRAGGASAVGLITMLRMVPSGIAAPFAAIVGDRFPRRAVMFLSDLLRAVALGVMAVAALTDLSSLIVYVLAVFVALVSTVFGPAQAALLPTLVKTPDELASANATSSTIESVGMFGGPAIAGLLLGITRPGVVFIVTAGTFLWSAYNVARISKEGVPERRETETESAAGVVHELSAGFRAILADSRLRLLVGLLSLQTLVAGALGVLIVVTALDQLDLGTSGVGYLNSAIGIGGLVGGLAAISLLGQRKLGTRFAFGILLWGLPLALIGVLPDVALAITLLVVVGVGNTLVDVAAITLLQRGVADEVLSRVFGVLEGIIVGTIGIGALLAPLLIDVLGIRGALIATGASLPVAALLTWRQLAQIDAEAPVPERPLQLFGSIPMFGPLPEPVLQQLALAAVPVQAKTGEQIIRQGDVGDRFYVISDGRVSVAADGGGAMAELEPGGYFGEIALLRDVPRTATVTALTDVDLYALERDDFLGAVTGHAASARAADAVIGTRLASLRPGVASV